MSADYDLPAWADGAPLRLALTSEPSALAPARRAVEKIAVAAGLDDDAVGEVALCVTEALANVVRHAYRGRAGQPMLLAAAADADAGLLRIAIRDWGTGASPHAGALPTEAEDPDRLGGLGLVCMGRLMSRVTFTRQPVGMLLEMERPLAPPSAQDVAP